MTELIWGGRGFFASPLRSAEVGAGAFGSKGHDAGAWFEACP